MKELKMLLVQLPVPRFDTTEIDTTSHTFLAAGYLKAMAHREGLLERADVEILEGLSSNLKGDAGIIETIVSKRPDILGFSCYVWNTIRTLHVAQEIKARLPDVKVICGGPEVTEDNLALFANKAVDVLVIGEGEKTFAELLAHYLDGNRPLDEIKGIGLPAGREMVTTLPREPLESLDEIPSPYLLNFIDPQKSSIMVIEKKRGCPYRCGYCYYGKNFPAVRNFSLERIKAELKLAKELGVKYIYFVDSCFNTSGRLKDVCRLIKQINIHKTIFFQVELKAELIDEETVRLLDEANVRLVEVGLQSTNPVALANVDRRNDLDKFQRGVFLLNKHNIKVIVGLIVGLPGDTVATIAESADFLVKNRIPGTVYTYLLCVLPGTALRAKAEKFNLEFQSQPPYYALRTADLSFGDIKESYHSCVKRLQKEGISNQFLGITYSRSLGITYSRGRYPYEQEVAESERNPGLLEIDHSVIKVIIDLDSQLQTTEEVNSLVTEFSRKVANCFTAWVRCSNPEMELDLIRAFIRTVSLINPFLVWNVILEPQQPFPLGILQEIRGSIFYYPGYLDNMGYLEMEDGESSRYVRRLFLVLPFAGEAFSEEWINELSEKADVFWSTKIGDRKDVGEEIGKLCQRKGYGLLVDFEPGSSVDFILDTLKLLQAKNRLRKPICFKNWVLQRVWDVEFEKIAEAFGMRGVILNYDKGLGVTPTFFTEEDLMLDMAEWILATRKSQEAMS